MKYNVMNKFKVELLYCHEKARLESLLAFNCNNVIAFLTIEENSGFMNSMRVRGFRHFMLFIKSK